MPHRFAVWRTSSRFSDGYSYSSTFSAAQDARWPSPQADLANMAIVSDPTQTSGKAALCDHARSRRKPEVITSRAPATECLHAHARVARMSWLLYGSDPPDPDSMQMVLVLDPSCRVPNRLPQGLLMVRRRTWRFVARVPRAPLGCVHAWGVARARHSRVSLRNGPLRAIPDSLRSPQGFEMRVARAPSPFLDGRKSGHIHPTPTCIGATGYPR